MLMAARVSCCWTEGRVWWNVDRVIELTSQVSTLEAELKSSQVAVKFRDREIEVSLLVDFVANTRCHRIALKFVHW